MAAPLTLVDEVRGLTIQVLALRRLASPASEQGNVAGMGGRRQMSDGLSVLSETPALRPDGGPAGAWSTLLSVHGESFEMPLQAVLGETINKHRQVQFNCFL